MAGDGNCLFRSLGDQVEGKPEDHAEIRAQVYTMVFAASPRWYKFK